MCLSKLEDYIYQTQRTHVLDVLVLFRYHESSRPEPCEAKDPAQEQCISRDRLRFETRRDTTRPQLQMSRRGRANGVRGPASALTSYLQVRMVVCCERFALLTERLGAKYPHWAHEYVSTTRDE